MVTLTFRYESREARMTALAVDGGPETYDLCTDHAERTRPPHGWTMHDDRPVEAPTELPDPDDLRSSRTVAVLAAALRGDEGDAEPTPDVDPVDEVPEPDEVAEDAVHTAPPAAEPDAVGSDEVGTDEVGSDDDVAAQVDVAALDAIVEQPFDDVADTDLLASPDEADPRPPAESATSSDALTELRALSEHPDPAPTPPARTVPGARRPD